MFTYFTPAQIKAKIVWIKTELFFSFSFFFFFFYPERTRLIFTCVLRRYGAFLELSPFGGSVGGQLRGVEECPIQWHNQFRQSSGKVPESDAGSVCIYVTISDGLRILCEVWWRCLVSFRIATVKRYGFWHAHALRSSNRINDTVVVIDVIHFHQLALDRIIYCGTFW